MIGTGEIVLGSVVIVLLFGATKIPQIARALGQAAGEWRRAKEGPPP